MKNLQAIKKHNDRMALVNNKSNVVRIGFNGEFTNGIKCAILKASYIDVNKYNLTYK